jgi:death-on-curing protein
MVEAAHYDQVREHGGLLGVWDDGLLESALARPRHRWSFEPETDLPYLAASYGFGPIKNHPFLDGNKRIGFVAMNMFLLVNGFEVEAPEPEVIAVMLQVASGTLNESGLGEWLRSVIVLFSL